MNIKNQVTKMDELVSQGAIVEAVESFFSDSAKTRDDNEVTTSNKAQMIDKMEGFVSAIAEVKAINHHRTLVDGNVSASEFTFDFKMKDGSDILWHEIITRVWNDDEKVTEETYFKAI